MIVPDRWRPQVLTMLLQRSTKTFLFSLGLFAVYLAVFLLLDRFTEPPEWDEVDFWQTTLSFSHSLLPSFEQLRDYSELNTPLPFIIFGGLEYLFHQGVAAGRLLNFTLCFIIAFVVGVPLYHQGKHRMLAAIGLLLCPYFLWLGTRLYTDMIAIFFSFWGVWFYLRNQHGWSGLAFVLAIASRQFMLAFPVGIACYEIVACWRSGWRWSPRWIVPLLAASTIFGWIWLFNGPVPASGAVLRNIPPVQQQTFALAPDASLLFLASVGLYFVIPEWFLFSRRLEWRSVCSRKNGLIAAGLLILFILFPPVELTGLIEAKLTDYFPHQALKFPFFYGLALLTCVRFSRIDLSFWLLLIHCGLMLKAYPWDKYAVPLIVVFWYFKSINTWKPLPTPTATDGEVTMQPAIGSGLK